MSKNVVVVRAQWGDEGKGKIVDWLTESVQGVVRFNGGHNAGHTLVINGQKTVLRLIPSGVMHPHVKCYIGNGAVVSPEAMLKEIDDLKAHGMDAEDRIFVSGQCPLVLPYHIALDHARENALGDKKIGTTGRGIGPAYEDKIARRAVHVRDLAEPKVFAEKVRENCKLINFLLANYNKRKLHHHHGTYPFVTSSNTVAGFASPGSGVGPQKLNYILGITKAYCTRVGSGPFPTELFDEVGKTIAKKGNEFGAVTGRPRRCGWFDGAALRRAVEWNGLSGLAVMKLDVLDGFETVRLGVGYEYKGERIDIMPVGAEEVAQCKVIYEDFPGWKEPTFGITKWEDLPVNAQKYLTRLSEVAGCPIAVVSTGPDRAQTILLHNPFE